MIKHIVCVTLQKPDAENLSSMKKLMLSVKDNIPVVKNVSVEEDFMRNPISFDMMMFVELDSNEALMQYLEHPYHAEYIQTESAKYVKELRIFDFEC